MGIISLHNTPTLIHTDTLGRGFYTIRYLSPVTDVTPSVVEESQTLDIEGNRLHLTDGRGLVPLQYRYARLQLPCYQHSMDSGTQYTLLDVSGQPYHSWDAMDRETEILYDALRRPLQRITDGKTLDQYIYGETLTNPEDHNYRGQVYQTYDGSGMQQVNGYDFKGNPLSTQVQLLDDRELTDADWAAGAEPDLSPEVFSSSVTYDALNRPVTTTDPGGNIQAYTYDKGGMLKAVMLNNVSYVNDIHYDAKGQRQAIWYGNSTKTSYTYDPETFRLRRLLTVNLNNNDILQDLHYWYDPVGNITEIRDDAQQTLFFNNSVVAPTQEFTYDALYRLIVAEGRELVGTAAFGASDNWNDASWTGQPQPGDGNAVQRYTQQYTYDAVGNILELSHNAAAGAYTRTYDIATDSNRLLSTTVGRTSPPGSDTYVYDYDVRGNMETMPHLSSMGWNLNNELSNITKGTMAAWYQYSGSQRVRKYVDKGSFKEERIYFGSFEIYRKFDHTSSLIIERTTVHVSDDTGRIAMLEKRTEGDVIDDNGTAGLLTRYIYSNHLQSASLELDASGAIISYEEYHPYGTTSYQAMNASVNAVAKRYRYTGKERDDESGLYYHGARYYIPWLCRWSAVDPLESDYAGRTPYCYSANNPVIYNDPDGLQEKKGKGDGIIIYDVAVVLGEDISNPSTGTYLQETTTSQREKVGEWEVSTVTARSSDGTPIGIRGFYVYDPYLRGDTEKRRFDRDKYYDPILVLKTFDDLKEFRKNPDGYAKGARIFYLYGRPSQGQIKASAGVFYNRGDLIAEGVVQENIDSWTNPEFVIHFIAGMSSTVRNPKSIRQQIAESPNTNVRILDKSNSPLAEIDRVSLHKSFIAEEKSAKGIYKRDPKTNKPYQTPEEWSKKQILESTIRKMDAIETGVRTGPQKGSSQGVTPSIEQIRGIKDYRFFIDNNNPALRKAVNQQVKILSTKYPNYKFSVYYGN